jgi:hypothetical protein
MLKRLDGKPISGRLVYRSSDRSLDTELKPQGSFSSLLVNDVHIEVGEDGRLIYVWGYCPHESWTPARFDPPAAKLGLLQYVSGALVAGVSKRLNASNRWPVSYDPSSQWLCIGDESIQGEMVAFAPGAIAALSEGHLAGLWLHPDARG